MTRERVEHSPPLAGGHDVPHAAICWRPEYVRPWESLWALWQKVALLNVVPASAIRELFCSLPRNRVPFAVIDLRSLASVDALKLRRLLGLSEEAIATAVLTGFVSPASIPIASSEAFRFCPTCLKDGFHCALYQLHALHRCPIHTEALDTRCPACRQPLGLYRLRGDLLENPFACPHCGATWAEVPACFGKPMHGLSKLDRVAQWFRQNRTTEQWSAFAEWRDDTPPRVWRNARRFPPAWFGQIDIPIPLEHLRALKRDRQVSRVRGAVDEDGLSLTPMEGFDLYRSVRRHLEKHFLASHRQCLKRIAKACWWQRTDWVLKADVCVSAYALLLWRLRWENHKAPRDLFRRQRRGEVAPSLPLEATPSDPVHGFGRHIVALRLLASFQECVLIAHARQRRVEVCFSTRAVQGRLEPYWIVERSADGRNRMHWWAHELPQPRKGANIEACRKKHFEALGQLLI